MSGLSCAKTLFNEERPDRRLRLVRHSFRRPRYRALGASTSSRNTSSARNGHSDDPQPRHDLSADLAHLPRSLGNVGRNDGGTDPSAIRAFQRSGKRSSI